MSRPSVLLRFSVLHFLLVAKLTLLGWFVAKIPGAVIGASVAETLLLVIGLNLEAILARMHRADTRAQMPQGLARSLQRVMEEDASHLSEPRLMVFEDPAPNALVARSLLGSGLILVSQGLVSTLNEAELRAVLKQCVFEAHAPGISLRSFCAVIASGILAMAPRSWREVLISGKPIAQKLKPSTAVGLLLFVLLWPWARFWLKLGGLSSAGDSAALRKIQISIRSWGLQAQPGAIGLYICYPWSQKNVLSLLGER